MLFPDELIITLDNDHIKNGVPDSATKCPIALAIRQINPGALVLVNTWDITIVDVSGLIIIYQLPKEGVEFIQNFDQGNPTIAPRILKCPRLLF